MAEEQVKIQKTIYSLQNFNNVVNTQFSQLAQSVNDVPSEPTVDIPSFFEQYDLLFYDIPLSGSDESHLGLATRSLEYLGVSLDDLTTEISNLREENIELKNQILLTSQVNTGSLI
jgi:hypothetical protein